MLSLSMNLSPQTAQESRGDLAVPSPMASRSVSPFPAGADENSHQSDLTSAPTPSKWMYVEFVCLLVVMVVIWMVLALPILFFYLPTVSLLARIIKFLQ